jgi:hypothetical protein
VALALVHNPTDAVLLNPGDPAAGNGVSVEMVRDFIAKDLARYPALRSAAAAIQEIVVVADDGISRDDYARDVTRRYLAHMAMGDWAQPQELHIFETFVGPIVVYAAYGI